MCMCMWQSDDMSLESGPKRCRVTIDATAAATTAAEREAVVAMKVKVIKEELIRLGGSTLGLLEKSAVSYTHLTLPTTGDV